MKRLLFPVLVFSLTSTMSLQALTLKGAVDEVLTTNPIVQERLKNYNKTVQDLKIAKSEFAPSIDVISRVGYEKTYEKHTTAGFEEVGMSTYSNTLKLTQNLFNGFSTVRKIDFEKARVMAAAYNYVEQTNDVAYDVVREYINVLKYKALYNLEQENVTLTRDIFTRIQELNNSGFGTLSDVKKVDSSLQLAEFNFLTQQNNIMDAEYNLGKLVGRKVDHKTLTLPDFQHELPSNLDSATVYSMSNNPSILVTNFNIESAKAQLKESESKYYPKFDFEFEYGLDKDTDATEGHSRDYSAMLVFQYNLYRGGADVRKVRQNKSNIRQEYEIQRDIKRQIIEGLQLSWTAYTMIEKQLVFLKSYQENSTRTLELYREEFYDGQKTLLDLLAAQNDYINSKNQAIVAEHDLLFAKYRILDAMGEMVKSMFAEEPKKFYAPVDANYQTVGTDTAAIMDDADFDNISDKIDICGNTAEGVEVDEFGCVKAQEASEVEKTDEGIGPMKDEQPVAEEPEKTSLNSFKSKFLDANSGFTLSIATFSSEKEVNKFLSAYKLENDALTIQYLTKVLKTNYIKVVSGIYDTKADSLVALAKLPKSMMIHKPYIENITKVQDLYYKYN